MYESHCHEETVEMLTSNPNAHIASSALLASKNLLAGGPSDQDAPMKEWNKGKRNEGSEEGNRRIEVAE